MATGFAVVFLITGCGSAPSAPQKPTPTALAAQTLEAQMVTAAGTAQTMRVQFTGKDNSGKIVFNIAVDGQDDFSGTFEFHGSTGQIIGQKSKLYMLGGPAIAKFANWPVPITGTGWYFLPSTLNAQVLDTVATATVLQNCLEDVTGANYGDAQPPSVTVNGVAARSITTFDDLGNPDQDWQFRVRSSGTPLLVGWKLMADQGQLPATCNGGVADAQGPRDDTTGVFTFSDFGTASVAATPPSPLQLPGIAVDNS